MSSIGKRVAEDLYIHLSVVALLPHPEHRQRIEEALRTLPAIQDISPNVAKLNLRSGKLSLLAYPAFEHEPFPELIASWVFPSPSVAGPNYRHYRDSLNPPILHRKELLVGFDHPERDRWRQLTETAEGLGLFDDTTTIGFKLNWERLIAEKGYQLVDDQFLPLGNALSNGTTPDESDPTAAIQRHLTALTRSNLSAPIQLLLRNGLLPLGSTVFDYGCGRGDDIAGLTANGYDARGWDPHYAPDHRIVEVDVVNLGFVVNVIEDPAERVEAIHKAFKLARRVMSVGVMLYGSEPAGRPYRDGFVTSRSTFQKYFSQAEFKDYLEQVLHQDVFMVGPGVALVFADKDLEQRYSAGRFRTRGIAARLLATRVPRVHRAKEVRERIARAPKEPKISRAEAEITRVRPLLDQFWKTSLELGRFPDAEEVENLGALTSKLGSLGKAIRMASQHYDQSLLQAAAKTRADDVRLYLAVQQFSRRPAYRQLERRLQRDIKAFFGDHRAAQASGLQLLVDAADPAKLLSACQQAAAQGLGYLNGDHSLQLHVSLVERLPAVLRAYVACGLILWDAISEVQLVKIHIGSGKLTLMEFDDFDSSPTPPLRRRIKVNIRKQDYDLFEYGGSEHPKPLLYRKSRYMNEDNPTFSEQLAFDEALDSTGILQGSKDPDPSTLAQQLELKRWCIRGLQLHRSEAVPELDQKCGANFTYRSFIQCGETQQRLGVRNLPLNPATYNALYDLATQILDPVIEYFGGIRLTYGFCSAELSRKISKGVAPRLDQHASCEVDAKGVLICKRAGASCDFIVDDEDMFAVAEWIIEGLPFDRLYIYGRDRPIHVSVGPESSKQAFRMTTTQTGRLIPTPWPT